MKIHKTIMKSGGIQIILLVAFILIVWLIGTLTDFEPGRGTLIFWGIIFSIIPAVFWLSFFYQKDRLEPEPKHYVIGVFLLGAFLAYSIGIPVVKRVFNVSDWLYQTNWGYILGSIFVIGIIHEFLIYVAVRYTVYPSSEFDEWIDGIIYATAAGLGFATMLNIYLVVDMGGAQLLISAIYCVINALAYASFAAVIGYCLAKAKFRENVGQGLIILGILIAAVLNGLFFLVQRLVIVSGMQYNPWKGFVAGIVLVAVIFTIVEVLMRRSVALEAAKASPQKKEAK